MSSNIGWISRTLGGKSGIAEIVNGSTPSTDDPENWNGDIFWVTPTDVGKLDSIYLTDTQRKITKKGFMSCSTKIIPVDSVLMTSRAPVGNLAINKVPLCTNQGFKSFILKENIDPHYLYFYLKFIVPQIEKDSHGNTFPEITKNKLEKTIIKLPIKRSDQQVIVATIKDKLVTIEQMRKAALRQKEAVEAMQGALLREVFPYKPGNELPWGWRWERIDNIAKVNKIRKKKAAVTPDEPTSFVPMDSVDDVTGRILKTLFRPYKELGQSYTYFENGDIIFAKITPCMQNGKCAIVENMKNGFGFGSSEYIVLTSVKELFTRWIYYFLRTIEFRKAAEDHFTGSAGQQRVQGDFVRKYLIPIPDDENLVRKLCDELDNRHKEYFKLLKQTNTQLEAIEALPAAILREVFEFKS